jgi:FAD synthase
MQIGNVTNQYINNYHYQNVQQINQQKETRAAEKLTEQQLLEYNQQLYREQQRWLAYIMMMQFFANNRMWSLLNQMRIQRTIDLTA